MRSCKTVMRIVAVFKVKGMAGRRFKLNRNACVQSYLDWGEHPSGLSVAASPAQGEIIGEGRRRPKDGEVTSGRQKTKEKAIIMKKTYTKVIPCVAAVCCLMLGNGFKAVAD